MDAAAGEWQPWEFANAEVLMAVAIGDTEALSVQAVPDRLPAHWFKFCALAKVWARSAEIEAAGQQLRAIAGAQPGGSGSHGRRRRLEGIPDSGDRGE